MKPITDISQVKTVYSDCIASIQNQIGQSDIDADTKFLLDSISQQTAYVLSSIIEYLENQ